MILFLDFLTAYCTRFSLVGISPRRKTNFSRLEATLYAK